VAEASLPSLLERRLVIVTGKGGTGKTTVTAALGLAAARRGRRVLVAEVGREAQLPGLFGVAGTASGSEPRAVHPGVTAIRIDPYAALAEYLGLQLGLRGLVERVLRNPAFHQLMDASPGWRELITLGKVWHLEQMREPDGRARFDLLVIDAPATGHGLTFLDVPRVVVSAVRAGPLRRHAGLVEAMIADAEQTLLLPVALAEELPAQETAELVARAQERTGIAVDRVVVNAVARAPFPPGLEDLDERLARLPAEVALPGLPPPRVLAACTAHLRQRFALNREYLAEIAGRTGLPLVVLPLLPGGVEGLEALETLGAALLAAPADGPR
jgi:anion-transporting  ArsA/GET3 family ATPase